MNKKNAISIVLYSLSIIFFFGYLITKKSGLMATGGLFMICGAIAMLSSENKKTNKKH